MNVLINHLLAQNATSIGNIGTGKGFGPFSNTPTVLNDPIAVIAKVASTTIGFITISAAIYFIFQFLVGAFLWISASADKGRLTQAQDRLTHALIGLIIVVATYSIVGIVGSAIGIDIFLENSTTLVNQLQLK